MSQTPNTAIAVIGIDIGKNSFHVVGHDARGAIVLRQKWSRGQQSKFIPLRIVPLHAPHVGAHQVDGCVKDALVERFEIAFLNQQRADFLQSKGGVKVAIQFVKHKTNNPCGAASSWCLKSILAQSVPFPSSGSIR